MLKPIPLSCRSIVSKSLPLKSHARIPKIPMGKNGLPSTSVTPSGRVVTCGTSNCRRLAAANSNGRGASAPDTENRQFEKTRRSPGFMSTWSEPNLRRRERAPGKTRPS